jgi:hypothetical protein
MSDKPTIRICAEHFRPVRSAVAKDCSINYFHPPTECRIITLRRRPVVLGGGLARAMYFADDGEEEDGYVWTEENK